MVKGWQITIPIRAGATVRYSCKVFFNAVVAASVIISSIVPAQSEVAAAPSDPVDLQLGGTGATPWNIANLKPGDNGTKLVELHNAGTKPGFVTIWVSDIINGEGLNPESETGNKAEPGELGNHLLFGASSNRSSTTLSLPARITDLPDSATDPDSIEIIPLQSGETVNLEWSWMLPTQAGNDIQGDRISFTLNYLLTELQTTNVTSVVTPSGNFTDNITVWSQTGEGSIRIAQGTTGKTKENDNIKEIWFVELNKTSVTASGNIVSVGAQHEAGPHGSTFDRPVTITLDYDPANIPARATEGDIFIATWNETTGEWVKINSSQVNTLTRKVTAQVIHFSRFTVVVYVPPPLPPAPAPEPVPIEDEVPSPPPPTVVQTKTTLSANLLGDERKVETEADGTLLQPLRLTAPDGDFAIEMMKGSRITSTDGKPITRLEVKRTEESIALPDDMMFLSPLYRVVGYIDESVLSSVSFAPNARLSILYDPRTLPQNAFQPFIANYTNQETGWVPLEPPAGSLFEVGKADALIYHASVFAALAKFAPLQLPLPVSFEVSNLTISPKRIQQGKPVTISATVANKGATEDSYEMYLMIDGIIRGVEKVTLSGYSSKTIRFEVSDLAPGTHTVKIAGLSGEFQVVETAIILPSQLEFGWLIADLSIAIIISALLLALYMTIRKSRRSRTREFNTDALTDVLRHRNRE